MNPLERITELPFTVTEQGTIRIGDSRVSLDSIVHNYKLGATAEQIVDSFPSLSLADVHLCIGYYKYHLEDVENYMRLQASEADEFFRQIECDPAQQERMTVLRERIQSRAAKLERDAS